MTKKVPVVDVLAEFHAATKALAPAVKRLTKALASLDPAALPVGAVSDLLYDLRGQASTLKHLTDPFDDVIDPAIKALDDFFVTTLKVGESSGVQGMRSRVQVTETPVPLVKKEDFEKFLVYVVKTKQWDLLKRDVVSRDAVRERWDNKKTVKYVDVFHAKRVSCTRLSGKGAKK